MPRLIDSSSRADTLALAINHLIATAGIPALTLRRIAQVSRVSPAAMLQQFGSRENLLRVAVKRTSDDLIADFVDDQPSIGLLALVPTPTSRSWCDDPTVQARVWMAWLELARNDEGLERCIDEHHRKLLTCINVLTEGQLSPTQRRLLMATSTGLQSLMADPVSPLEPATAKEMLADVAAGLGVAVAPIRPGDPVPEHLRVPMNWMRGALQRSVAWRPSAELADAMKLGGRTDSPARARDLG